MLDTSQSKTYFEKCQIKKLFVQLMWKSLKIKSQKEKSLERRTG